MSILELLSPILFDGIESIHLPAINNRLVDHNSNVESHHTSHGDDHCESQLELFHMVSIEICEAKVMIDLD